MSHSADLTRNYRTKEARFKITKCDLESMEWLDTAKIGNAPTLSGANEGSLTMSRFAEQ
jgi:hypothetical protein